VFSVSLSEAGQPDPAVVVGQGKAFVEGLAAEEVKQAFGGIRGRRCRCHGGGGVAVAGAVTAVVARGTDRQHDRRRDKRRRVEDETQVAVDLDVVAQGVLESHSDAVMVPAGREQLVGVLKNK